MRVCRIQIKRHLVILLAAVIAIVFMPQQDIAVYADDLTLSLVDSSKTVYMEGEPIEVIATGTDDGAWVGLYRSGDVIADPSSGGSDALRWYFIDNHNGEWMDITSSKLADQRKEAISKGSYEIILFGDDLYDDIRTRIAIEVVENPDIGPGGSSNEPSLSFADPDKAVYKIGEAVSIKATGPYESWVGLYKINDKTDPDKGGVVSLRWFWVRDHNGEFVDITDAALDANNKGLLGEGSYKVILFGDGGYTDEAATLTFDLAGMIDVDESQFSLETDKTEYRYKEPIKVKAKGLGINEGAWVGLYKSGKTAYSSDYLFYYSVKGNEDVLMTMQNTKQGSEGSEIVDEGTYQIVLFASNGYTLPILTKEITVTKDALSRKRLRDPGCVTMGLEYVIYEDGTSKYRTLPTLGGHSWGTPQHIEGTASHKYICERDDSHQKTEACTETQSQLVKQASVGVRGEIEYTCDICGGKHSKYIPAIKAAPALTAAEYAYTGSEIKPALNPIVDSSGAEISSDSYTVTYPANSGAIGSHAVAVTFTGNYTGTYQLQYTVKNTGNASNSSSASSSSGTAANNSISLKNISLKKVKRAKKAFKATWSKSGEAITGYQIEYSLKKDFSDAQYKNVADPKKTSVKIKKLKKKKRYYVRIRAYKTVNGNVYYSAWSSTKTVKTKK